MDVSGRLLLLLTLLATWVSASSHRLSPDSRRSCVCRAEALAGEGLALAPGARPPLGAPRDDSLNVHRVGRAFNECGVHLAKDGNYAYLQSLRGLLIYDVADLTIPTLLGFLSRSEDDLYAPWGGLAVLGNTVSYVNPRTVKVDVVDVADRTNPQLASEYVFPGTAPWAVGVRDSILFVSAYDTLSFPLEPTPYPLQVINVADPYNPVLISTFAPHPVYEVGYHHLAVVDSLLYIQCVTADSDSLRGLHVVNAADQSDPQLLAVWSFDHTPLPSGSWHAFQVEDSLLYIVTQDNASGLVYDSFFVYDVNDTAGPVRLGALLLCDGSYGSLYIDLDVSDHLACVFSLCCDDYLCGTAVLVDVSDPVNPTEVGRYIAKGYGGWVFSEPGLVCLSSRFGGLSIVDVSEPSLPELLGICTAGAKIEDVVVRDTLAYTASISSCLQIFNIGNPANPQQVNEPRMDLRALCIEVVDTLAYVGTDREGLRIFSVADPLSPQDVGEFRPDTTTSVRDVAVKDTLAYLSIWSWLAGRHGLLIVNVADAIQPTEVSFLPITAAAQLKVIDTLAYVASGTDGMTIVNVADPAAPQWLSNTGIPTLTLSVESDIACTDGIRVYDVSDPANPIQIGYCGIEDIRGRLLLERGILYATTGDRYWEGYCALHILDLGDPTAPTEVGYYKKQVGSPPWFYRSLSMNGIAVVDSLIYLAAGPHGLWVLQTEGLAIEERREAIGKRQEARLFQNRPNPFARSTLIRYLLPDAGRTTLSIYDLAGRLVKKLADEPRTAGSHHIPWDGRNEDGKVVPRGLYFCRLSTSSYSETIKVVLLR